jgi:hypothetical protein
MSAKVKKVKPPSYHKEKLAFIHRILGGSFSSPKMTERVVAKKIFERYKNDLDFLSKVSAPSWLKDSMLWFLTEDGLKYLDLKYKEFYFKIEEPPKIVDFHHKVGDDILEKKPLTVRDFLNE